MELGRLFRSDVYRSAMLTVIAILLAVIAARMPHVITLADVSSGRAQLRDAALVHVQGGTVSADIETPLDVQVVNPEDFGR
jgi:hypothetical protein